MKFSAILLQAIIYSPILAVPMPKGPAELVRTSQLHGPIEAVEPGVPDLERRKVPAKSTTTPIEHPIKGGPPRERSLESNLERRKRPAKSQTTVINHPIKGGPPSARDLESSS
ncbi:hypothetical protein FBEOM_4314 [Fusarium beomiforme]|uniref:Uncharacterized protein n=1 Tax=Fusarium beomiforme TaxID=44412 RepID=A0A9P5ANC1_9HYPO|nr:hypothetical protein FBEOM_4314 [Fusarium beomiforme]